MQRRKSELSTLFKKKWTKELTAGISLGRSSTAQPIFRQLLQNCQPLLQLGRVGWPVLAKCVTFGLKPRRASRQSSVCPCCYGQPHIPADGTLVTLDPWVTTWNRALWWPIMDRQMNLCGVKATKIWGDLLLHIIQPTPDSYQWVRSKIIFWTGTDFGA